jgi:NADH dehydrogenase
MKRIVTIGSGFAGLAAAKALKHADADVVVIDRANHNLFQPLLYQVATTVLASGKVLKKTLRERFWMHQQRAVS